MNSTKKNNHPYITRCKTIASIAFIVQFFLYSCEQFIEIAPPSNSLSGSTVFNSDATAIAATMGIYERMMESYSNISSGDKSISLFCGLSADEFTNYSEDASQTQVYVNQISTDNSNTYAIWTELYKYIYTCNSILEGLNKSTKITVATKKQLEGESKFIRAFCYFYLTNLFGDVPLITKSDYKENLRAKKTATTQIYSQIEADLSDAQNLLAEDYTVPHRIRPNSFAAAALLSRVYLYEKKWALAENAATTVINETGVYQLEDSTKDVFLKESSEAIWHLPPTLTGWGVYEALFLTFTSIPTNVSLSETLVTSYSEMDSRKKNWIGNVVADGKMYYYPYKYKVQFIESPSEYLMIIRLAEIILIRSEARAQQDNLVGAQEDLQTIKIRSGITHTTIETKEDVLLAIEQERKRELFSEWGHRWLDLKRTDRASAVLTPEKNTAWKKDCELYPLPQLELINNPQMGPQNPGY